MHGQTPGVPGHRSGDGGTAEDHQEPHPGQHPQLHQDSDGGPAQAVQAASVRLRVAGSAGILPGNAAGTVRELDMIQ